ncbi:MAG: radical SAM/SPASM domain-containing protein [Vicinamibacterales bacterium]
MHALVALQRRLNSERQQFAYNRQWLDSIGKPVVFQIELTNHCPMTCAMCPRTEQMSRPLGYMSRDLYRRIIEQAAGTTSRVLLHHFGDSLLHRDIGTFIRWAHEKRIRTYLSANPILLTAPRIQAVVDNALHELVLSVDGATDATSALVRGPAARNLALAEERLLALIDYRRRSRKKKPEIVLQIVRQKQNAHEIDAWLRKWRGVPGLKRLKVKSYVTWDGASEAIASLRVEAPPDASTLVCDKPWTSLTILWDGRVVPCCFDYDGLMTLGHAGTQSLDEIWKGERLRQLRSCHRDGKLGGVRLCANCTDKEGYAVGKWYYPLNRALGRRTPLGAEWHPAGSSAS